MQQGETITYAGPAKRSGSSEQIEVDGRFVVDELRESDAGQVAYLSDARLGDVFDEDDRDLHRYQVLVADVDAHAAAGGGE